jgi:hypothetical protein
LQSFQGFGVGGARERHRTVAPEVQVLAAGGIYNFRIEASLAWVWSNESIKPTFGHIRGAQERAPINVMWQTHPALRAQLPNPSGLEAKLDQPWRHKDGQIGRVMIVTQTFRHQTDNPLSVPPGSLHNLVRGPVEVEAIDVGSFDDVSNGSAMLP